MGEKTKPQHPSELPAFPPQVTSVPLQQNTTTHTRARVHTLLKKHYTKHTLVLSAVSLNIHTHTPERVSINQSEI